MNARHSRTAGRNGFTLVEMLVALAIFSLISVAGVAMLQSASRTQLAVKNRLADTGREGRAIALIEADLAQSVARAPRRNGQIMPAFATADPAVPGMLFAVTRSGYAGVPERPGLARIAYGLAEGALVRIELDARGNAVNNTRLLTGLREARVRFRDEMGAWRSSWEPRDPALMPRAIELVIAPESGVSTRLLFLVGAQNLPGNAAQEAARDG